MFFNFLFLRLSLGPIVGSCSKFSFSKSINLFSSSALLEKILFVELFILLFISILWFSFSFMVTKEDSCPENFDMSFFKRISLFIVAFFNKSLSSMISFGLLQHVTVPIFELNLLKYFYMI